MEPSCYTKVQVTQLGLTVELLGNSRATLTQVGENLHRHWCQSEPGPVEVARIYGEGGIGARDPRTNATVARLRHVLLGKLDILLEAWREQLTVHGQVRNDTWHLFSTTHQLRSSTPIGK